MTEPQRYVPIDEYIDMTKRITSVITDLGNAADGLRTVTLLIVAAIAKQPNIDGHKFMDDISLMIENHYPPEVEIPLVVLDFRAEIARRLFTKE